MWSVSISEAQNSSGSAAYGTAGRNRNRIFHLVPRNWSWLVSSCWQDQHDFFLGAGQKEIVGKQKGSILQGPWVPCGGYKGVRRCKSSCQFWKPSPLSKAWLMPALLQDTSHPTPHSHPVDQSPVSHPQIPDFPIPYPPHAVLVLLLSVYLCNPNFLPHLPLGQAGCEGCARMYQVADNVWLIGMTIEVPKSDTTNKGLCSLVIPALPLGSSLWCVGCSLTFWHCIVYHSTAEEDDFSLPWDGYII